MSNKGRPSRGRRRLDVGAEVSAREGVHFRAWAPGRRSVSVVVEGGPGPAGDSPLQPSDGGYFEGIVAGAGAGTLYRYRLDDEGPYADPASRFQPEGPHGPSEVVDPGAFAWSDASWEGRGLEGAVFHEIHVGTFTPEGTWDSALEHLPRLAKLGVTVLEVMPVADFPGRFGWGYDGVNLYAPCRLYGEPDAFRRFVDRAHAEGLAVILDVNYNHLGPDGNFLARFAPAYFSESYQTEWGRAVNFDGEGSGPVRSFVLGNAAYWVEEFHLDGLRIDATQSLFDTSEEHIIAAIARRVREAAGGRKTLVVGENEPQDSWMVRPVVEGGHGLDAVWVDDFHHAAMVAATGRREAYYADYRGTPQEFVSACRRGFLWQGQWDARQGKRRGSSTAGIDRSRFVFYLQNHDQIANSARGERIDRLAGPGHYRALTALLLLGSGTPYLFQGQEFASSSPFLYFGDLEPRVAEEMHEGRRSFLKQFASLATPEMRAKVPRPHDPAGFAASKLDHSERGRGRHAEAYALHEDLLTLRREHEPFRSSVDGATLGTRAFALRFADPGGGERLLLINLGADLRLDPPVEPLLAPPSAKVGWAPLWSSEDPRYGGQGVPPMAFEGEDAWQVPACSATVLTTRDLGTPDGR
jgi:maltooligosyltrehalose trehalohydrolase